MTLIDDRIRSYRTEIAQQRAEIARLTRERDALRLLLVRYQAANYIPEDCDLYAEAQRALEQGMRNADD